MTESIDLDAYFRRIGYEGPRTPCLEVLATLHARHARAIPFENLDVLLGRPVRLDLASLQDKLVHSRRGGYCFEHNTLFAAALSALGFQVRGLAGRVQWMAPAGAVAPRTHMLLQVDLPEGDFLADVGFGAVTLTAPLRLELGLEQSTSHETFRLVAVGDELQLQVGLPAGWSPMVLFGLAPQAPADYELANWFTSTHPHSRFKQGIMAGSVSEDRRFALRDTQFSAYNRFGLVEQRTVALSEITELLNHTFGVAWPDDAPSPQDLLGRTTSSQKR